MSWKFSQSTGDVTAPDGKHFIVGYAGCGPGLNNPDAQNVKNVGPLPRGKYTMVKFWVVHPSVGSYAIELEPWSMTQMFGRSSFLIHGLAITDPLHSSHGCPVIGNNEHRSKMWLNNDHVFEVIE